MRALTQFFLFLIYALLGVFAAVLPPRMAGVDQDTATVFGILVFFAAWQTTMTLTLARRSTEQARHVAKLEQKIAHLLKETETLSGTVKAQAGQPQKSDKVISELSLLKTLLEQVIHRQAHFDLKAMPDPSDDKAAKAPQKPVSTAKDKAAKPASQQKAGEKAPAAKSPAGASVSGESAAQDAAPEEEDRKPQPPSARETQPAPVIDVKNRGKLLDLFRDALSENRVDLYIQPIVALPSRRTVHYECYSRVRDEDGGVVLPSQFMPLAEDRGLVGTLDNLLLFRLIQLVRRLGPRRPDIRFFCNLSRACMEDGEFLSQLIDFMTSNYEFSSRLVFEITEDDWIMLDDTIRTNLEQLRRRGFRFSLDHARDFDADFAAMAKDGIAYMKADVKTLTRELKPGNLKEVMADLRLRGIRLIATHIETEGEILQVLDLGLEYGQGYIFGEPSQATELNRSL